MSKIYDTLITPYAEQMGDIPWNVYPRPQLKRDSFLCLNGEWDFRTSLLEEFPSSYYDKILVPFPPESKLSGLEKRIGKEEILYYRRFFTLPEGFRRDKLILHFGAVDCHAEVYIKEASQESTVADIFPSALI